MNEQQPNLKLIAFVKNVELINAFNGSYLFQCEVMYNTENESLKRRGVRQECKSVSFVKDCVIDPIKYIGKHVVIVAELPTKNNVYFQIKSIENHEPIRENSQNRNQSKQQTLDFSKN